MMEVNECQAGNEMRVLSATITVVGPGLVCNAAFAYTQAGTHTSSHRETSLM